MPGPMGNFDDVIQQILMQQQQQGGGAMAPDGTPVQMAGAGVPGGADTYAMPQSGMPTGRQGMVTDQYAPVSNADMQQAILLKKALQQMRQGR
jgi:hypothetical protein